MKFSAYVAAHSFVDHYPLKEAAILLNITALKPVLSEDYLYALHVH